VTARLAASRLPLLLLLLLAPQIAAGAVPADAAQVDLGEIRTQLAQEEFDLSRQLERAALELGSAEARLSAVQRRIGAAAAAEPGLDAEEAARKLEVTLYQRSVALLEARVARVTAAQQIWERRRQLLSDRATRDEIGAWRDDATRNLEDLARQHRIRSNRLEALRRERKDLSTALEAEGDARVSRWLGVQRDATDRLIRMYEEDLASLAAQSELQQALVHDLEARREPTGFGQRLRSVATAVRMAWNYEIMASKNHSITVGKALSAFVVFLLGYFAASAVTRVAGRRALARFKLDEGATHAFESLAFYALMVAVFLLSLRIVDIPLTAFAVVGGALAIGVGFGSQNVVNNFISGVILLAERPIKLGDLVELGGIYGTIERIGLRSTRVRTGDNIHIIVPNSSFLENNVINWTHNDEMVRIHVKVGVVYGSATRDVARIIREVLDAEPRVLKEPQPLILFTDFGDNSLDFEARFWIRMRTLVERLRVESDVRFCIDDRFREAGIVIAFPQRDVHLDSTAPIEVRVLEDAAGAPHKARPERRS
jgi:potassium-dependent mechanosensitive channel